MSFVWNPDGHSLAVTSRKKDAAGDGRWLAYTSDESGRSEVYVRRYPQGEIAVSTGGGEGAVWRPDGRELFFQGLSEGVAKLMAVPVTPEAGALRLAKAIPLFDMRVPGQRPGADSNAPPPTIVVVQHFEDELKRLAPSK